MFSRCCKFVACVVASILVVALVMLAGVNPTCAAEFTTEPTPELAEVHDVRLFVRIASGGACQLPMDEMVAVTKQTLNTAELLSVDGFDPSKPDWPILEVHVDSLELMTQCNTTVKITLRVDVTGEKVEGNHYYDYKVVWGDAKTKFVSSLSAKAATQFLKERLLFMFSGIHRARQMFPDL